MGRLSIICLLILAFVGLAAAKKGSELVAEVDTPQETTGYSKLPDSLLGKDVAVVYYGKTPAAQIKSGCEAYKKGNRDLDVKIAVGGKEVDLKLRIVIVKGCRKGPLQAVLTKERPKEPTRKILVDCPEGASPSTECRIYLAGDDVTKQRQVIKANAFDKLDDDWDYEDEGQLHDDDELDYDRDLFDEWVDAYEQWAYRREMLQSTPPQGIPPGTPPPGPPPVKAGDKGKKMGEDDDVEECCPPGSTDCDCGNTFFKGNCFSGSALVTVEGQGLIRMEELKVGHKVLSIDVVTGLTFFDEVYSFGHRDFEKSGPFVSLDIQGADNTTRTLQLTGLHYLPVMGRLNKYAMDVSIGETVTVLTAEGTPVAGTVVAKSLVTKKGVFNPFTKYGYLIVDSVLASAHSDWILDYVVPAAWTPYLPAVYQVLFRPLYWLYTLAGPEVTTKFNERFIYGLADSGITAAWLATVGSVALASLFLSKAPKY